MFGVSLRDVYRKRSSVVDINHRISKPSSTMTAKVDVLSRRDRKVTKVV